MKKAKKKAIGRPRKKYDRRDVPISLKLTAEERERFELAADATRQSLSDFVRQAANEAARKVLGDS